MRLHRPSLRPFRRPSARVTRSAAGLLAVGVLALGAAGCSDGSADEAAAPTTAATSPVADEPKLTQFTRDGTFQSHLKVDDIDFVFNLYPNKQTPRTQLWYPRGKKHFALTLTGYDLRQGLREPFSTKRLMYLDTIQISSSTKRSDGGRSQSPLSLDAEAKDITFDPQPTQNPRYGMLVTSPKGSLELRDLVIGSMAPDTTEVVLRLTATVWVQDAVGGSSYSPQVLTERVPITIFPSDERTKATRVPITSS